MLASLCSPREAALYIVRLVNHKNMHVGMLALAVKHGP